MKRPNLFVVAFAGALAAGVHSQRADAAAPAFTDANWASMGVRSGVNGSYAAAVDAAGNLYIGGNFTNIGSLAISNIAKWNGTNWSPVGAGLNGPAGALQFSGTNLYVAGSFTTAGGIPASHIAKWDGSTWSALGSGTDGAVAGLAISGSDVYVTGTFSTAGGVAATNIAKWNGSSWSALGAGGFDRVGPIAVVGNDVYVAGYYMPDFAVNSVMKWNSATGWTPVGPLFEAGFPGGGNISALVASGGFVYAGGDFWTVGGVTVNCVARWTGSTWAALGPGLPGAGGNYPAVTTLAVSGSTLYAGGYFARPGTTVSDGIAKWNGSSWSGLGSGVGLTVVTDPWVTLVAASGGNVYAMGYFSSAGGVAADGLAKWNSSAWSPVVPAGTPPPSLSGPPYAVAVSGTNLYVGGEFGTAGTGLARCLARWDGSSWSPLGSGADSPWGLSLTTSGTNLYAAMWFTPAGGFQGSYLARWNGSAWTALGQNADSEITSVAVSESDIYVGGYFSTVDGGAVAARRVAKWNGLSWSALGTGLDGFASALAVSGTNVYVGGSFTTAGGAPATNVARWDGSTWSPLGSGLIGDQYSMVRALVVWNGDLYAGGSFTNAGGLPANYIARWNGTTWSSVGGGLEGGSAPNPSVYAFATWGSNLFVGGQFVTAGGMPAANVARWDGSTWSALGSGVNRTYWETVYSLAVVGSDLYVGGGFEAAGGKASPWIARAYLVAPPGGIADSIAVSPGTASVKFYGNPGHQFDVQRTASLAPPIVWSTVSPGPLSPAADGVFTFTDTTATNGTAYYRSRER